MLVGVISDTHDNLPMIDKAIRRLNKEQVSLVLHAGDYVSPFVIPRFKALSSRLVGVLGNNDGDHERLRKQFTETQNCELRGRFALVDVEGFRIALLHGDEAELLNTLAGCGNLDAVVHGHTHTNASNSDKTLVVNPGEICGYLTGKPTLALLDTRRREVRIVRI